MPKRQLIPIKTSDVSWSEWFQMFWDYIEWPVVAILSTVSIFFGFFGFFAYRHGQPQYSYLDALYESLQLFSMQVSFDSGKEIPTVLQIARFLSPAMAIYTLSQAFIEIFKKQIELFRLVLSANHVVVCGLGQKGLLLTRDLRKENQPVVIIEQDGNNPYIEFCRELGAIIVIGDATDIVILRKAGVERAKRLIAVCGDDGVNVQVADQAQKILFNVKRNETLICNINIVDKYLKIVLKQKELTTTDSSVFRMEMFNIYDSGARILLKTLETDNNSKPPHLLVIGLGDMGESIIVNAARKWCLNRRSQAKLDISVIDSDTARKVEILKMDFPLLKESCIFHTYNYHPDLTEYKAALFPLSVKKIEEQKLELQESPITNVYVCHDDTLLGLHDGFRLLQELNHQKVQILIRMNEDSGLANILREMTGSDLANLKAFGLLDQTCKLDLLDDISRLARVIHEDYYDREIKKGITAKENPNVVIWGHLNKKIKESNLHQAENIGIKLAAVKYGMEAWNDYGKEKFTFEASELSCMAEMEHIRWYDEKISAGWKYAAKRDDARKLHPDLVQWNQLTPEAQQKDMDAVRLIPHLLARAGLQVYRLK